MTVPKPEEFRRLHRGKKRAPLVLVVSLVGAILVGGMYTIITPTMTMVQQENEKAAAIPHNLHRHAGQAPIQTVDSEMLKHESMFLDTIKNCLPSQNDKCAEFIPENNQGRQRIAVVTPPGEMGNLLFEFIHKVVQQHEKLMAQNNDSNNPDSNPHPIELFRTSHVPPYGYGKNHGLTKIIRFVPILVMGVADALQNILVESHHHEQHQHAADAQQDLHELQQSDISLQDLQVGLRQMMRFHCRLSHVAAHTAMLSLNINDYFDNYEQFMSQLYGFLKMSGGNAEADEQEQQMLQVGSLDEIQLVSGELGFVSQILTRIQTNLGHDHKVLEVLDQTLLEEMKTSKNLSVWPCPSFWTAATDNNPQDELSIFGTKIAQAMSPNCTAPFAKCWVPRDLCEARGDGPCKEQK